MESSNPDLRRVSGDARGRFSGTNPWISQGLVLGIGVSLTLMALLWSGQSDRAQRESEFRRQTRNGATTLERTTNRYIDLLLSMGDLHQASPETVSGETFCQFVQRSLLWGALPSNICYTIGAVTIPSSLSRLRDLLLKIKIYCLT